MQPLSEDQKWERRSAGQAVGRSADQPRFTVGQSRTDGLDFDVFTMPVDAADYEPIQAADGSFFFMAGFSAAGGSDPLF